MARAQDRPVTPDMQIEEANGVRGLHSRRPPLDLELGGELTAPSPVNVRLPSLRLKHMSGGSNTAWLIAALLAACGESVRRFAGNMAAEGDEAPRRPIERCLMSPRHEPAA